jgi:pyruvate/2-oxoglutarate dehydrogenase complex dihydrolipoamide acyltransferase (E2) component
MSELVPIVMPRENVSDESVLIVRWMVNDGAWVETDQVLAEVETSKALVDVHSPAAGYLRQVEAAGAEVAIGAAFAYLAPAPNTPLPEVATEPAGIRVEVPVPAPTAATPAAAAENNSGDGGSLVLPRLTADGPRFSRAAQALIQKHGLAAELFSGAGLVRTKDIMQLLAGGRTGAKQMPIAATEMAKVPAELPPLRRERLPRRKRMEANFLSWAVQNVLPSSVSVNCATRGLKRILTSKTDGEVAPLALMLFETARLLRKYPAFNAVSLGEEVGYYDNVDIGVAMDEGGGLVVPVIRHADRKTVFEIAHELRGLMVTFVEGKLTPEQLNPGTFTVTDLSALGTSQFQPMINHYQSAILGIGAEQFLPGQETGYFTLTLAFDHSISEGRTAALLLAELRSHLASYEQTVAEDAWRAEAHCIRCLRTAAQLQQLHEGHVLVRSEMPKGVICSLCLAGY